jgi:hypothetical protein
VAYESLEAETYQADGAYQYEAYETETTYVDEAQALQELEQVG